MEVALRAVLQTEAGRRLGDLRDGEHRDERAAQWQPSLARERAEERRQGQLEERRREERSRLREEERIRARKAAWESFMRKERRDLELRKEGQLAGLLGEALAGEPPAALQRLAREDQRQAEEGLVALTSNGKVYYKLVEELTEEDMGARIAAKYIPLHFTALDARWCKFRFANHAPVLEADLEAFAQDPTCL